MRFFVFVFLSVLLISCGAKQVPLHKSLGTNEIKVAIITKNFSQNNKVSSIIEGRLMDSSVLSSAMGAIMMRDDIKIRIVNRDSIQKVLAENSFSLTGLTQKQTSLLGKLLNADILIFPAGLSMNSNDEFYSKKDKKCIVRKAYANVSIKAVRADNAEVIISDNYDGEESYEECSKTAVRSKVPNSEKVKVEALTKAIEKFASDFKDRL
jgi:hypothetical protein